ncbi:MAG: hypothetical protein HQM07_03300 [Zetaproteobacteria bacterium]|nr:hypothetical protein [Zetaproteobacteria bacterium]
MSINLAAVAKAKQLNAFLQEQVRIYIMVDATLEGVEVPQFLLGDPALRLVLNLRMPQTITINSKGVESNLSFSGRVHQCVIPLDAIWAACDRDGDIQSGMFWEESIPAAMREALQVVAGLSNEQIIALDEELFDEDDAIEEADESTSPIVAVIEVPKNKFEVAHENKDLPKKDPSDSASKKRGDHLRVIK